MRLLIKFGETHAVRHSAESPDIPHATYVETACGYKQTISTKNRERFTILADGLVGCYICKSNIGEDDNE